MAVGLDAMLEAVELPTGVSDLATGLADVDGDALTLGKYKIKLFGKSLKVKRERDWKESIQQYIYIYVKQPAINKIEDSIYS